MYAVLSRKNSFHHLRLKKRGVGVGDGEPKDGNMTRRRDGVWIPLKNDGVIFEQPLTGATKKSELSGWQISMPKNFLGEVHKSFLYVRLQI